MLCRSWPTPLSTTFGFGEAATYMFSSGYCQWRGLMQAEPHWRRSGETAVTKGWQNRTGELPEALNHSKPKQEPSLSRKAEVGGFLRGVHRKPNPIGALDLRALGFQACPKAGLLPAGRACTIEEEMVPYQLQICSRCCDFLQEQCQDPRCRWRPH